VSPDQDPALAANADESQHQQDADGPQQRAATSDRAGRDSTVIAGNSISDSRTGRGDIVSGNKTKKTAINLGAVAVIIGILIGLVFRRQVGGRKGERWHRVGDDSGHNQGLVLFRLPPAVTSSSRCSD
jgi:hypothetical protein